MKVLRTMVCLKNWMRGRDTIEFLGLWESFHNSDFKPTNSMGLKKKTKD